MTDTPSTPGHRPLSYFNLAPLGRLREAAGYSQRQVSKMLAEGSEDHDLESPFKGVGGHGSSRSSYSGMERGRFPIDGRGRLPDVREFLATVYGVTIEQVEAAWEQEAEMHRLRVDRGEVKG